jgi:hypothetical protein
MQMGATVASDGNCPSGTVLSAGTGRFLYANGLGQLCINGTFTGSVTANSAAKATAAAPSYSEGTTNPLSQDLSGNLRTIVTGVLVAQGSTTSGQSGILSQGAVSSSAPSYTTGQTAPLSLDTAGGLRVSGAGQNGAVKVTVITNSSNTELIQATASTPISFTAAGGPTQIIAASGSKVIYITHWDVVASGAGTFALVTGTGSNCGTNTTYLTGAASHPLSFAANGGISAGSGLGPILVTGAGGEVCAITTGAVDFSGSISYAQF